MSKASTLVLKCKLVEDRALQVLILLFTSSETKGRLTGKPILKNHKQANREKINFNFSFHHMIFILIRAHIQL